MGTIQRVVPNGAHSTEQVGRRSFIKHICLDRISHFLAAVFGHKAGHTEIAARFRNNARPRALDGKFTYGDLFASLFAATNRAEFKREAIDWAKAREKAQPWHSWSYALEASLTADPLDRQRALAMANYLDPKSARLASFKQSDIDAAVKIFGQFKLILNKSPGKVEETSN